MILVDYSMTCKSNFAIMAKSCTIEDKEYALQNGYVDLDDGRLCYESFRYAILNSIRKYGSLFGAEYGSIVLAADDKNKPYWRKEMNPHYKGNRKTFDSPMPWMLCLEWMDKLLDELDQNMPYNIISVPGAEADDIIGTLAIHYSKNQKVLVVSRDHDFKQLLNNSNVKQYDPVGNKFMNATITEAKDYLFQHIVKGDTGDGIPNILSPESIFMDRDENGKQLKKQSPISKKKLELWRTMEPSEFCPDDSAMERYERNKQMIDLSLVPEAYVNTIIDAYESGPTTKHNDKILMYIAKVNSTADEFRDEMFKLDAIDFYDNSMKQLNPFEQRLLDLMDE